MYEINASECYFSGGKTEVTTLEYGYCSIEICRSLHDSKVGYSAYADFRGDEDAARHFDHEMYNVNNIYSDGGGTYGADDGIVLECPFNPRDIIETYLGTPHSVSLEVKN